jgi:hypothetical protein
MPRPNAAQLAYGSATVVCSTLAMLLLSGTSTGIGVAVIGIAALALGLVVALTVPMPRRARPARSPGAVVEPADAPAAATPVQVPVSPLRTGAEAGIRQHSLRH